MKTMMQKYELIKSEMKRGEKTRNQEVEADRTPSTFSVSRTEKTSRLSSQTQISKTETPSHLRSSSCRNSIEMEFYIE